VGGGIVHQLSYHMAKSYMVPFEGVFVASAGYMFGHGGVPRKSIITAINNRPTPTLEAFIEVMNDLKDGERVPVQFFQLSDIDKQSLGIVQVDRRWHGFSIAMRNDLTGLWDYKMLPPCVGEATFHPQSATALELDKSLGPSRYIIPSFVYVQTTLPFKVDGVSFQHRIGIGLILDADRGFIVVDRKTCPMSIGDILVTFSNSVIIPAKMIYLHQVFNFAILKYDPTLLGTTVIQIYNVGCKECCIFI
jgi:S1-C subfamily serine protease